jgi:hypothetical protein
MEPLGSLHARSLSAEANESIARILAFSGFGNRPIGAPARFDPLSMCGDTAPMFFGRHESVFFAVEIFSSALLVPWAASGSLPAMFRHSGTSSSARTVQMEPLPRVGFRILPEATMMIVMDTTCRYLAFDTETAKTTEDGSDWRSCGPLGISCVATLLADTDNLVLWHGGNDRPVAAGEVHGVDGVRTGVELCRPTRPETGRRDLAKRLNEWQAPPKWVAHRCVVPGKSGRRA